MPKPGYYAVRGAGVFTSWDEARPHASQRGAQHKKFSTRKEAEAFMRYMEIAKPVRPKPSPPRDGTLVVDVDGSHFKHAAGGRKGWGAHAIWRGRELRISRVASARVLTDFLGREVSEDFSNPTMELCAAADAMIALGDAECPPPHVVIRADHISVIKYGRGVWKPRPDRGTAFQRAAVVLVEARDRLRARCTVRFECVKGHSGAYGNDQADAMAKSALEVDTLRQFFTTRG